MTRVLIAALAVALIPAAPAFAQSAKPVPTASAIPSPAAPAPSATPEPYTSLPCAPLVKRANLDKQKITAHTIGILTEAALRAHDFDALLATSIRAQAATLKAIGSRDQAAVTSARATEVKAVNASALAVYRAQADVRACFGLR
jgi:hypothetical protein